MSHLSRFPFPHDALYDQPIFLPSSGASVGAADNEEQAELGCQLDSQAQPLRFHPAMKSQIARATMSLGDLAESGAQPELWSHSSGGRAWSHRIDLLYFDPNINEEFQREVIPTVTWTHKKPIT